MGKRTAVSDQHHNQIACIECDLLLRYSKAPSAGERFACPRCGHVLARGSENPAETVLALSLTALMALIASTCFSFLSFEAKGQSNAISLISVVKELYLSGFGLLGVVVIAVMVLLPFVYLIALLLLTYQTKTRSRSISPRSLARLASKIYPWTMADVFIFGVLVALVKMAGMAEVTLGISFWSYIVFTFVFVRISLIVDTHCLWSWVEYGA